MWKKLNEWRVKYLFITPGEAQALVTTSVAVGRNEAQRELQSQMEVAHKYQQAAQDAFLQLQEIKLDVNSRGQFMDIRLILDRKALRVIDVEDAARLLAFRTTELYRDAINKRLENEKRQPQKQT